jgi:serine/threonine protein kinase
VSINDFKFLRILGRGGFASVYLAAVRDTTRLCAVKVMSKRSIVAKKQVSQVLQEQTAMVMASRYG